MASKDPEKAPLRVTFDVLEGVDSEMQCLGLLAQVMKFTNPPPSSLPRILEYFRDRYLPRVVPRS